MYIHEAIKSTTDDKPYIVREQWDGEAGIWRHLNVKILATNTPECCFVVSASHYTPRSRWNPDKDDLIADDWIITG